MHIPVEVRNRCDKCRAPVVWALNGQKRAGVPVAIAVDTEPDTVRDSPNHLLVVSVSGGKYHALPPTSRAQRAAMMEAGVEFHMPHAQTCARKGRPG